MSPYTYAARDYLRSLTRGRDVRCSVVDVDHYGRKVVECTADGQNLGCAMIAGGQAVPRYGHPDCGIALAEAPAPKAAKPLARPAAPLPAAAPVLSAPPPEPARTRQAERHAGASGGRVAVQPGIGLLLAGWIALFSALGFVLMADDKRRAIAATHRRVRRIPESTLLGVAAAGGSPGVLLARRTLRHKTLKQPFSRLLTGLAVVQIALLLGLAWRAFAG